MKIKDFFDQNTSTFSYVVIDDVTKKCAIIDPVLDYDQFSGKIFYNCADNLIKFIQENNFHLEWILETHIHADHLTSASYIKNKIGGKIAIGEGIFEVLKYWTKAFNIENEVPQDGSQFDHIFKDNENFKIGNLSVKFLTTPGHTPACGSYFVDGDVFVGDLMFMPNLGTGRADFPGGDAKQQFNSIQKIFNLGDDVKIFTCHDYPKEGEKPKFQTTVKDQKENNIFAKIFDEKEYVKARLERDKKLAVPKLLYPSIQVNIRCGKSPNKEQNQVRYIKIPIDES